MLVFIILMATSFGHNDHHQSIAQKLKQSGTYYTLITNLMP